MTERSLPIMRIAGAVLAAVIFVAIFMLVISSLNLFGLDPSHGDPTAVYGSVVPNVSQMLWTFRGIDSVTQGLLLVVAAVGAATLFRLEKGKEEHEEE